MVDMRFAASTLITWNSFKQNVLLYAKKYFFVVSYLRIEHDYEKK